jgi:hypothetical protein
MGRASRGKLERREGFRQAPEAPDTRKMQQAAQRHVTAIELAQELQKISKGFEELSRVINNNGLRLDAVVKTMQELELGPFKERLRYNQDNLKLVQEFVVNVLADKTQPTLNRVRDAVKFNRTQEPDFRVTEEYFPVRRWLGQNTDGLSGEELAEIAESFGYSRKEILRVLVEERLVAYNRKAAA